MKHATASWKLPSPETIGGTILDDTYTDMKVTADFRESASAQETGWTASVDAGKDVRSFSQLTLMATTTEGEHFHGLVNAGTSSKNTKWYAAEVIKFLKNSPGGPRTCFHVVVDAGTPGARGKLGNLQRLVRLEYAWVTITLCQGHQADLGIESLFAIPVYAGALTQGKSIKTWVKEHIFAYAKYIELGGGEITQPETTRQLYAAIHCENLVKNRDVYISVFHSTEFSEWKANQTGEKGKAALDLAAKMVAIVDNALFWRLQAECWGISQPHIKLLRLNDGRKPNMGQVHFAWVEAGKRIEELGQTAGVPASRVALMKTIHEVRTLLCCVSCVVLNLVLFCVDIHMFLNVV